MIYEYFSITFFFTFIAQPLNVIERNTVSIKSRTT